MVKFYFYSYSRFILVILILILYFYFSQIEVFAMAPEYSGDIEPDWYTQDRTDVGVCESSNEDQSTIHFVPIKSKISAYYIAFKNKTSLFLWKRHSSKQYSSYEDFKRHSNYNTSLSWDLKRLFGINKK